jgi:hypothetical protein
MQQAACRGVSVRTFFEDFEEAPHDEKIKILALCESCSVRQICENFADSMPRSYGVWGGKYYYNGKKKDPIEAGSLSIEE